MCLLVACAHNVAQDKKTGADGKLKGAQELRLENGEAKSSGIVTYPGGDRVDWKVIELPEKQRGTLDIKLTWSPPRPGLQLAFDVFDQWNTPLVTAKKQKSKKRSRGRSKTAQLPDAKGKYFIRVYAMGRGDAGKYKLTVEFKETAAGPLFDPAKLDIPDPPKLADLPVITEPCDDTNFDPKKPECKLFCPLAGAPPGWPGCKGRCPTPPTIDEPSCHATMPCPNPPDERVKACTIDKWPPCDKSNPDMSNPKCRVKAKPQIAKVIRNDVSGDGTVITVAVGTDSGITKDWRAQVLRGNDGIEPLSNGDAVIIKLDKNITVMKVRLTTDQVAQNKRVRLSPP